jgi:hypothetical protein
MFTLDLDMGTVNTIINAPIGLQEMVLAGCLIIKGLNPIANIS